jgi:hypothetical protein
VEGGALGGGNELEEKRTETGALVVEFVLAIVRHNLCTYSLL